MSSSDRYGSCPALVVEALLLHTDAVAVRSREFSPTMFDFPASTYQRSWMFRLVKDEASLARTDSYALALALRAFRSSSERHRQAWQAWDLDNAYITLVEATMWACAIDEQMEKVYGNSYKTSRDVDENGRLILGIRWLRDRHSHQLPVTADKDMTPFFGSPGGIISLSAGIRWKQVAEIPPPDPKHNRKDRENVFRDNLAGESTPDCLAIADRWFTILEQHPDCILNPNHK